MEPTAEAVQQRVKAAVLQPLHAAEEERSMFSRARIAPRERQVRVTQQAASKDAQGRDFFAFFVDVRFGKSWREGDIVGCVYTATGDVFVKRGEAWRPAEFLVGKRAKPVSGVCEATDEVAAR